MRVMVLPYSGASRSARLLAEALGGQRIRLRNSRYSQREGDVIINWGSHRKQHVDFTDALVLNSPYDVEVASNKYLCLQRLSVNAVPTVLFYLSKEEAQEDLERGSTIVVRHTVRGSGGEGIEVFSDASIELPDAPLYTKYIEPSAEYRVHVMNGKMFDLQQKKKRNGSKDHNPYVRNHAQGWVFCRQGVACPDHTVEVAVDAVNALGLDFGAVDVLVDRDGNSFVLEVNTAPGLQGTTLAKYTEAFKELITNVNS